MFHSTSFNKFLRMLKAVDVYCNDIVQKSRISGGNCKADMFLGVGGGDAIKEKSILMPMIWANQHDSKSVCWLSMISRYTRTLQPGVVFEPVLVLLSGGIPIPIHLGPFVQRFRGCSHWRALSKTLSKGEANSAARTTHPWKIWISPPVFFFCCLMTNLQNCNKRATWMDLEPARCIVLRIVS